MSTPLYKRPAVIVSVVVVIALLVVGVLVARSRDSAPSAPQSVHAVAGNARATISWSAPSSDGGAAITSYQASSTPGAKVCTSATTSCVVTGLTNGVTYTFRVTATNSAGTSVASAPSNSVTPRYPACTAFWSLPSQPVSADVLAAITRYYTTSHLVPVSVVNNKEMILRVADQSVGVHHCSNADGSVASYVGMVPANASAAVMLEVHHLPYPVTGGSVSFITLAKVGATWRVVNEGTGP
jgi:hypothetical protein